MNVEEFVQNSISRSLSKYLELHPDIPIPTYVGSGWGVAKYGFARIPNSSSGGATVDVDISDLNLASTDDYEVLFVGMSESAYTLSRMTATSFTVKRVEASPTASTVVRYVVFAKGYGGVPNGGTTGQVLAKKSGADGDTEWREGGGGINFEVGAEKWYGTYTEEGVTYQVYSKIVYIPALPAEAGITNVPHGVTGIKQILAVQGFCSNSMIMNAPRQNLQDNISIYQVQKSGNIAIEVGKDRSSVSAYVTLIYAKNN